MYPLGVSSMLMTHLDGCIVPNRGCRSAPKGVTFTARLDFWTVVCLRMILSAAGNLTRFNHSTPTQNGGCQVLTTGLSSLDIDRDCQAKCCHCQVLFRRIQGCVGSFSLTADLEPVPPFEGCDRVRGGSGRSTPEKGSVLRSRLVSLPVRAPMKSVRSNGASTELIEWVVNRDSCEDSRSSSPSFCW